MRSCGKSGGGGCLLKRETRGFGMDGYLRARELIGSRGEALTGGNKSSDKRGGFIFFGEI